MNVKHIWLSVSLIGVLVGVRLQAGSLLFQQPENLSAMRILQRKLWKNEATRKQLLDILAVAITVQRLKDLHDGGAKAEDTLAASNKLLPSFQSFFELLELAEGLVTESLALHSLSMKGSPLYALTQETDQEAYLKNVFTDIDRTVRLFAEVRALRRCLVAQLHVRIFEKLNKQIMQEGRELSLEACRA